MDRQKSLTSILALFHRYGGVLPARQIADALDKDGAVVEGMLETLVRMGKLELADAPECEMCPMRTVCTPSGVGSRCYRLPEQ
jgi:hypothetical protein